MDGSDAGPSSMPMMRYRRKSKPENLHPRTELSQRFLAKDEDIAWKAARITVPPAIPDNTACPNAMRDERGLLRREFRKSPGAGDS